MTTRDERRRVADADDVGAEHGDERRSHRRLPSIAAVLAGSSGATTGAITYYVLAARSAPATCPGTMSSIGTSSPSADGSWSPAAGYTPTSTTKLWWYAFFAGDALDNPRGTTCGAAMASTTVKPAGPTRSRSNIGTQTAGASFNVTLDRHGLLRRNR